MGLSRTMGFPGGTTSNVGGLRDMGSIHRLGRSSRVGNGNPLQYSCLENPKDRGPWQAIVHEVTESWTQLSKHFYSFIKKDVEGYRVKY